MTSGAQEGLSKVVEMCVRCNDPVIMPDPVYTGAVDLVKPSISYHNYVLMLNSNYIIIYPIIENSFFDFSNAEVYCSLCL